MTVDHALELRRQAKEFEASGDMGIARELLADSAEQLERARAKMPAGSKLAPLLDSVLSVWRRSDGGNENLGDLEAEVDAELDRLISELERTLGAILGLGASAGAGGSIQAYQGHAEASSALAPASAELALPSEQLAVYDAASAGAGSSGGSAGSGLPHSPGGGQSSGSHPAQVALRALRLDDDWPTELSRGEIRRRYMREALVTHPDKGPLEEKEWRTRKFQELSDAYSTLEVYISVLERMRGGGGGDGSGLSPAPPPPPPPPPGPPDGTVSTAQFELSDRYMALTSGHHDSPAEEGRIVTL
eukprot:TRINITY_DN80730_c0_g1_i1.p1 TRINITY_DN80730_c0_g1~~TRINITY_DN80730_c0_g1_i1.p1  ORF type:complete len:303 (-),score=73.91 TRINITY_DN80730_c0_g1_i1:91-999(-)